MSNDYYWLRLVRRWLRDNRDNGKADRWNVETGEYTRHHISRDGRLVRVTVEHLDPETFAREHISADVISIRAGQKPAALPPTVEPPGAA
jgi:hypothetical protein